MTTTRTSRKSTRKPLTADEIKQKIEESKALLNSAVENMLTSEGWEAFLRSRKGLRTYSANNMMLVALQCPGATDVRPYGARNNPQPGSWKYVGRYAKPGEKAIRIYAPLFRREEGQDEPVLYGFKLVPVFDVSQTDGEPLPARPSNMTPGQVTGDAPAELWDKIEKLVVAEGFHVVRGDRDGAAEGTTTWASREVWVKGEERDAFSTSTLIHELAHIMCEHETRNPAAGLGEVEAESVAFIVGDVAGMTTLPYSVPYVAGWAGDTETVAASAKTVLAVADKILKALGLEAKKS